jgi:hypothetical protein
VTEIELAKILFPQAVWTPGDPLSLLESTISPIDIFVSCPPFNARTDRTLTLADTAGKLIELRDDLGGLILAAATAWLSSNGVGLFVVPQSFFISSQSVLKRFVELGFNVDAALALPPGSFGYSRVSGHHPSQCVQ